MLYLIFRSFRTQVFLPLFNKIAYLLSTDEEICTDIAVLIKDTERRILSAADVYTSGEIKREDIYLAKKNFKELVLLVRDVENARVPMVDNFDLEDIYLIFRVVRMVYTPISRSIGLG